jgi:hypothetical protein
VAITWEVIETTNGLGETATTPILREIKFMNTPDLLFPTAAFLFVGYLLYISQRKPDEEAAGRWKIPALLSLLFALFSAYTVATEGPLGFIEEHTRALWSSQIWFDLLLGVAVALWWMVPPARALGMRVPAWLALVAVTGNIGLLAMLSRLWWLQAQAAKRTG